jgi:hypothetical protein
MTSDPSPDWSPAIAVPVPEATGSIPASWSPGSWAPARSSDLPVDQRQVAPLKRSSSVVEAGHPPCRRARIGLVGPALDFPGLAWPIQQQELAHDHRPDVFFGSALAWRRRARTMSGSGGATGSTWRRRRSHLLVGWCMGMRLILAPPWLLLGRWQSSGAATAPAGRPPGWPAGTPAPGSSVRCSTSSTPRYPRSPIQRW